MAYKKELFYTYDSAYADTEVLALASTINEPVSTSWDLFPESGREVRTSAITWYDGSSFTMTGTIPSGSSWNNSDTTALAVSSAFADQVNLGDVIRVESEYLVVNAVSQSGDTIGVQARGHGDSSAAAHDASSAAITIYIIGHAQLEGDVNTYGISQDSVELTNYVSTIMEKVEVTFIAQRELNKDISDRLLDSRMQALARAYRKMNVGLLLGMGAAGTKAATSRTTKGLFELLTDHAQTYDVSGAITEAKLKAAVAECADLGGMPDTLIVPTDVKRTINDFYNSSSFVRITDPQDQDRFGMVLGVYMSEVGPIRIVADHQLKLGLGYGFLVDSSKIEKVFFQDDRLRFVPEISSGNSRKYVETLQGSWSLVVKNLNSSHSILTGITS